MYLRNCTDYIHSEYLNVHTRLEFRYIVCLMCLYLCRFDLKLFLTFVHLFTDIASVLFEFLDRHTVLIHRIYGLISVFLGITEYVCCLFVSLSYDIVSTLIKTFSFLCKLSLKRSYLLLVLSKLFTFLFDSYTALLKVSYKVFKSYILRVKAFSGIIYNVG